MDDARLLTFHLAWTLLWFRCKVKSGRNLHAGGMKLTLNLDVFTYCVRYTNRATLGDPLFPVTLTPRNVYHSWLTIISNLSHRPHNHSSKTRHTSSINLNNSDNYPTMPFLPLLASPHFTPTFLTTKALTLVDTSLTHATAPLQPSVLKLYVTIYALFLPWTTFHSTTNIIFKYTGLPWEPQWHPLMPIFFLLNWRLTLYHVLLTSHTHGGVT